jgi:hypothetical protein
MALEAVKAAHSLIALVMAALVVWIAWRGWLGKLDRAFALGAAVVVGEGLILALNGGACPFYSWAAALTPAGEVVHDIYLPRPAAEAIPAVFTPIFVLGLVGAGARLARRHAARSRQNRSTPSSDAGSGPE